MAEGIQKRADECKNQDLEKRAYVKFKVRIAGVQEDATGVKKLLAACQCYFEGTTDGLPWADREAAFQNMSFKELKDICLKLCTEAINRDMIDYIRNAKRGNLGARIYAILS